MRFRNFFDFAFSTWAKILLIILGTLPLVMVAGLLIKSWPIFEAVSMRELLLGTTWSPMKGVFGFYPFVVSTILVTLIAMVISVPICLLSSIYLTQYAPKWLSKVMQPTIDILAGLPSVVYGVWGILVIVPTVEGLAAFINGTSNSGYSILSGALVLSVMCIPYMLNLMIEILNASPEQLKESALALGATYWQMIKKVLIRYNLIGILSAITLGFSKAIGETIAVLMVVGNVVQVPSSLFDAGYPLPSLIANNYGEMMSIPLYDSALMVAGLLLFAFVVLFQISARLLIKTSLR